VIENDVHCASSVMSNAPPLTGVAVAVYVAVLATVIVI
jgi:hypothetical protein